MSKREWLKSILGKRLPDEIEVIAEEFDRFKNLRIEQESHIAELEQRLMAVEEELDELDKELFIFASDVIYSENEKIPNWLVDKARAIYYRPRLGKGE